MKTRITFVAMCLGLLLLLPVALQAQQPRALNEMESSRLESLENTAKDTERQLEDARKESRRAQELAKEAKEAEDAAFTAAKEARRAVSTEKKAMKAREKADKQARKSQAIQDGN